MTATGAHEVTQEIRAAVRDALRDGQFASGDVLADAMDTVTAAVLTTLAGRWGDLGAVDRVAATAASLRASGFGVALQFTVEPVAFR